MKLTTLLIVSLSFSVLFAYSQSDKEINDIIVLKKKNIKLKRRIEIETTKSVQFYNLAVVNTQSAKLLLSKLEEGTETEDSDKEMAGMLFHKANLYTFRSDSISKIIPILQDSVKANIAEINRIAKNFTKINPKDTAVAIPKKTEEAVAPVVKQEVKATEPNKEEAPKPAITKTETKKEAISEKPQATQKIYTVQIKADTKSGDLIKGMPNLKVVHFDDGYYRYFVGEYTSYSEASKAQKKLVEQGYSDCFIKVLKK